MKNFRKVLVLVLSLAITFTFIPSMAFAAVGDEVSAEAAAEQDGGAEPIAEIEEEFETEAPATDVQEEQMTVEAQETMQPDTEVKEEKQTIVANQEEPSEEAPEEPTEEVSDEKPEATPAEAEEEGEETPFAETKEVEETKEPAKAPAKAETRGDIKAVIEMQLDKDYSVSGEDGERSEFSFTPTVTGTYKFYSFDNESSDPYGRLYCGEEELYTSDDYNNSSNFMIQAELQEGETYTLIAHGCGDVSYSYKVKLIKLEKITVTFKVDDGYMWDDESDRKVQTITRNAIEGDTIYSINYPTADAFNGALFKGWAVSTDPNSILSDEDHFTESVTLVPVWGPFDNRGTIELNKEYNINGSEEAITTFTFTPEESGYFKFFSYNNGEFDPYGELRIDGNMYGNIDSDDGNFAVRHYLEKGKEYTFVAREENYSAYSYSVKLIKIGEITVRFVVSSGYMYDDDDNKVKELTKTTIEGEWLDEINTPSVYSDTWVAFKGWGLTPDSTDVLSYDYIINESVNLYAIWGTTHNEEAIGLNTEYHVDGEDKEVSVFKFTPEESGYYKFYSYENGDYDPYGEIWYKNTKIAYNDDGEGESNFGIKELLEAGKEYILVAKGYNFEKYDYKVLIKKIDTYNVTFQVSGGYMWDDGDKVHKRTMMVFEEDTLGSISSPEAYSDNGVGLKGWALSTEPGVVLGNEYKFASNVTLVPVWGTITNEVVLELDTEYEVKGNKGDVTAFSFTPDEDGYYKFYSYDADGFSPSGELRLNGETINNDNGFSFKTYLSKGNTYTYYAGDNDNDNYSYNVMLTKITNYTITFKVTDGYMWDDYEEEQVHELAVTAFEGECFYDISVPSTYSYSGAKIIGWADEDEPETMIEKELEIVKSVVLVPVWGNVKEEGLIELDKEYNVSGEYQGVNVFTFKPETDGYYYFYSSEEGEGEPYGEVRYNENCIDSSYGFSIKNYFEAGNTYTFVVSNEYYVGNYSFTVQLTKVDSYTVTFRVEDGYMWDDDDQTNEYIKEVLTDECFGNIEEQAYSYSGARLKGWALYDDPGTVIDKDYRIEGNIIVIPVWGLINDEDSIELGKEYKLTGERGDAYSFTFTPEEDGYYKLYSYDEYTGEPYAELRFNGNLYSSSNGFELTDYLEAGETYTYIAGSDYYSNSYAYSLQLTMLDTYTVTFKVDNGYMWDDEGERQVQELNRTVIEGQNLGNIELPGVYSDNVARLKGWALENGSGEVLEDNYRIKSNVTLVAVWGTIDSKGDIVLDKEYIVTGVKGDFATYTFTPETSGYYRFYSYDTNEGNPYMELWDSEGRITSNYGFSYTNYFEKGITYTYAVGSDVYDSYFSYKFKLTKVNELTITVKVNDGYMLNDEGEEIHVAEVTSFEGDRLDAIEFPEVHSYNGTGLKGWALETESEIVLDNNYEIIDSVTLVAVWGTVHNGGSIELDETYSATGARGDITTFKFIPEKSGAYMFYSFNNNCDPYGEIWCDGRIITTNDDSGDGNNFSVGAYLEEGKEYTLIARELRTKGYSFNVKLTMATDNIVTVEVIDGYFWDGENKVQQKIIPANVGDDLWDVDLPKVFAYNNAIFLGWALKDAPTTILDRDNYIIEGSVILIPVWGPVYDKGNMELSKEYKVSGEESSINRFTFIPEDDGYYQFISVGIENDCDPYIILYDDGGEEIDRNDDCYVIGNFSLVLYLKAGKEYHLAVNDVRGDYSFYTVALKAVNITGNANGGFYYDNDENKVETMVVRGATTAGLWYPSNDDENATFLGWATMPNAVVPDVTERTYFTKDTTVYGVWEADYDLDLANAMISGISDKTYTGAAQTQTGMIVKYGTETLTEGTDYKVTYSANVNVGTVTITLTGLGRFAGTITKTFQINPASISGATIGTIADQTATGSAITPDVKVTLGSNTLVKGTDYTVSYANNINAGQATVTITGKGNYTGTATAKFTIKAKTEPTPTPSGDNSGNNTPADTTPAPSKDITPEPTDTTPEPTPTPTTTPDPTEEVGSDGTSLGEGASAEAAEAAITAAKGDKDLKGSVYNKLQVKQSKVTKNSIKVSWNKVSGAKKYVVYAGKSGKSNKLQKITTTTKTNYTLKKLNKKKLAKGTYYKFAVVALNSKGKVVTSSKFAHIATLGKKAASNPTKVTTKAKKDKVTVKVKKTFKLAGAYAASSKKLKIKKVLGMRYESTNTKVATVSSKGVIKGIKKGTCYVYAYAQNGLAKKIKVTVK